MTAKTAHRDSRKTATRSGSPKRLTDHALLARLEKARGTERAVQRRIVCDLAEVERRRLYLPLGYGSLFEFCTGYLRYSRSSAGRRIGAARCIARFPRMAAVFRRGECDLTALAVIAGVVTRENCAEVAEWIKGKSLREVEAFALRRTPARALRDQVRQIYVMRVEPDAGPRRDATPRGGTTPCVVEAAQCIDTASRNGTVLSSTDAPNAGPGGGTEYRNCPVSTPSAGSKTAQPADNKSIEIQGVHTRSSGGPGNGFGIGSNGTTAPAGSGGVAPAGDIALERKFKIQFAVDPEFMEKLGEIRSLLSTRYPKGMNFQTLFDILMTEYLERHSPEERTKKRKQRDENKRKRDIEKNKGARNSKLKEITRDTRSGHRGAVNGAMKKKTEKKSSATAKNRSGVAKKESVAAKEKFAAARTRRIPRAVRDEVFVRDGGRCTFVGKNGRRCEETWNLEIDHIIPFAKGGDNSPGNLRLLCAKHNRLAAERAYGAGHMKKFYRRE